MPCDHQCYGTEGNKAIMTTSSMDSSFPRSQLDSQWYHHCSLYLSSFTTGLPVVPSLFPLPFLVDNWTSSGTDIVPFTFPRSQLDSQWYRHCSLYLSSFTTGLPVVLSLLPLLRVSNASTDMPIISNSS